MYNVAVKGNEHPSRNWDFGNVRVTPSGSKVLSQSSVMGVLQEVGMSAIFALHQVDRC